MHSLRRAAVRALLSTSTPFISSSRALSTSIRTARPSPFVPLASTRSAFSPLTLRRTYATEGEQDEEKPQSTFETATQTVTETAEKAKDAVTSTISAGIDSVFPDSRGRGERQDHQRDGGRRPARAANSDPSTNLYIGNLYFEVTEDVLKKEFSRYGDVVSVKIIFDARGLSKGFGYIELGDVASATAARENLDGQVLEGRSLSVQYAIKATQRERRTPNESCYINAPSKTLFIGNMSYEMSDKDLNELFRDVKNVLDVRVAIDRRTGQPRGFAHADFLDVKSAQGAAEYLKSKTFYGRNLRVDFSANANQSKPSGGAREDN